jgi:hypothetical protein
MVGSAGKLWFEPASLKRPSRPPLLRTALAPRQATQTVVPWSVLPAQVVYSREDDADFGAGGKGERACAPPPACAARCGKASDLAAPNWSPQLDELSAAPRLWLAH